jgi:SAM-dependent methyltransferase
MTQYINLEIHAGFPLTNIQRSVHPSDGMYQGNPIHYLNVGFDAVSLVERHAGSHPKSILDMPCGFGRATRAFRARYPEIQLAVSDIIDDGVEFCAKIFDAIGLRSEPDFEVLNFHQQFDAIWVGSLITHLNEASVYSFFRFLIRHLTPTGRAIVSSHGAFVAGRIYQDRMLGGTTYGLGLEKPTLILDDYYRNGFGFAEYEGHDSEQPYGISICSEGWLRAAVASTENAKMIAFESHALDRHHDITVIGRSG